MSGRKSNAAQQTRIPPPLGAFPIPKSGSFGSQEKSSRDLYQNVDLVKVFSFRIFLGDKNANLRTKEGGGCGRF